MHFRKKILDPVKIYGFTLSLKVLKKFLTNFFRFSRIRIGSAWSFAPSPSPVFVTLIMMIMIPKHWHIRLWKTSQVFCMWLINVSNRVPGGKGGQLGWRWWPGIHHHTLRMLEFCNFKNVRHVESFVSLSVLLSFFSNTKYQIPPLRKRMFAL